MVAQLLPSGLDGNGEGLTSGAVECWMAGLMTGLARAGRWVLSAAASTEMSYFPELGGAFFLEDAPGLSAPVM